MGTVTALAFREPEEDPKRTTGKARSAKGKRNVNGEGNIRQRSDGRWEGRAYVNTTDGREVRKSLYGKTWEEVHEKLTKLQADTMSGKRTASTKMTVGEYLTYWLEEVARHRVRPGTYQSYEWLVRCHLVPALGKRKLVMLQAGDIRRALFKIKQTCQCCAQGKDRAREERTKELRAKRAGKPARKNARPIKGAQCCAKTPLECCRSVVSDATIKYLHRLLRVALQDAVSEENLLSENVARNLRLKYRYRPRFKSWDADEARRFLTVVQGDRLAALYIVALLLGLRRGEVLGLQWSDLDLDTGVIRVRHALHRTPAGLELGPVKSDGSDRVVAVPEVCTAALRKHRDLQDGTRREAGKTWRKSDYVFTTKLGTPMEPRNVNRHFVTLCDRAKVRRIRFHDLRHSCATLLYGMGVPIENIQDVLGHSSPTITKTIYVDGTEKVQRGAADKLDSLFEEDGG